MNGGYQYDQKRYGPEIIRSQCAQDVRDSGINDLTSAQNLGKIDKLIDENKPLTIHRDRIGWL